MAARHPPYRWQETGRTVLVSTPLVPVGSCTVDPEAKADAVLLDDGRAGGHLERGRAGTRLGRARQPEDQLAGAARFPEEPEHGRLHGAPAGEGTGDLEAKLVHDGAQVPYPELAGGVLSRLDLDRPAGQDGGDRRGRLLGRPLSIPVQGPITPGAEPGVGLVGLAAGATGDHGPSGSRRRLSSP
jgi:hypothetical protein